MFRLPTCPHCGTVYRYKDTKEAIRKKENTCYHCNKRFRAKVFPGILAGAGLPLVLCIAVNIIMLSRMEYAQLIPLFTVTVLFILLIIILIPFFTVFRKTDEKQKDNNTED